MLEKLNLDNNMNSEKEQKASQEDWLNEHGAPNYDYLESLANDDSLESEEELRHIAEDLDVENFANLKTEELIGRIRLALRQNEDDENLHIRR